MRHDFAGEIVGGRPQSAGEHDQVGSLERSVEKRTQARGVVPNHRLALYLDADRGKAFADEQGVGVEPRPPEELAPDRNDLGSGESGHTIQAGSSHIMSRSERLA